jgi:hypothetical protein
MARTYEPIASTTISGSSTSTFSFTNIPATFTDLVVVEYLSFTVGSNQRGINFGDASTSTLYSSTNLRGNGSVAASVRFTGGDAVGSTPGVAESGTGWMTIVTQVMSYANTNINKTFLQSTADSSSYVYRTVGLWRNTSAIDTVKLFAITGAFAAGSRFSLYGIKAA